MTSANTPDPGLRAEMEDLRARLADAEETLRAIRSGEVDALVVSGPEGDRVYTLKGEDRSYRVLVESVNEGALILTSDGSIMYANSRFARMIGVSLEKIIGVPLDVFVSRQSRDALETLLRDGARHAVRREMHLIRRSTSESLPVYISISPMVLDEASALSVVVTDLTEAKKTEQELARHRDHLEDLVRERTAEVQTANEELRVEIEERRQIEEALRESEERFRIMADGIPQIIWVHNAEGLLEFINRAYTEFFGVTLDQVRSTGWQALVHPDDYDSYVGEFLSATRERRQYHAEGRVQNARGEWRWIESYGRPRFSQSGEFQGIAGSSVDITERKQAEEALRESEERYRALIGASSHVLYRMSPDWSEMRTLRGGNFLADTAEPNPNWLQEYIPPDEQERVCEAILNSVRTGSVFELEHRVIRSDGSVGWTASRAVPMRNAAGDIVEWFGSASDISGRVEAEESLAESESFFRAVYDSTQDAIVITDDEGTYISANPAVEDVFGLPQDQLVGRRVAEFMEPGFFDEMWPSFLAGGTFVAEHKLIAADGSERIVESHATAEMLPGRHLSVIHDVTGEVRLREQLTHQVALLQQALLPPAPKSIHGYEVASKYIPAFAGEQEIGGDFYDLFLTESGAIGLMIGDVSGKGIEAAALAAVTRSTVRAFAYDLSSPSAALNHANALLAAQQFNKYQFVTAFLALVDPATGEIRYASAGHPPAIVQCAGGAIELLDTGSAPLGVLESPDYAEYTTRLDVGDRMVVYTDGVSESRKGSTLFGTEGIERVLVEHGDEPPDVLAESILDAAKNFAEGKLRDETALVIIHRV